MMGGALGLAVLASLAAAHTGLAGGRGTGAVAALNAGDQMAFLAGAVFAALAGLLGGWLLWGARAEPGPAADAEAERAVPGSP